MSKARRRLAKMELSPSVSKSHNSLLFSSSPLQSTLDSLQSQSIFPPGFLLLKLSSISLNQSPSAFDFLDFSSKFPLQSLSIKQRTIILQRGLADRSPAVTKECLKLLKDEWLMKSCNANPIELLKYLDVETYESIGVSVMEALLKSGLVKLHGGQSINQFLSSNSNTTEDHSVQQVDAKVALYLRTLCKHLQTEAQSKGSDAAMTSGSEAVVYASEASDSNEYRKSIIR
ncbi:hypothetical protein LXL04_009487 [Taraxacum kok-saghyz]